MQAIGEQLAGRLDPRRLHLHTAVRSVRPGSVSTDDGTWRADAVVVATDPGTAAGLLPAVDATTPRQVTTHLHVLPESPWPTPLIVLGQPGGRLVNSVVVSDAQPRYSPDRRALVASSTLEPTSEAEMRAEVATAHDVSPSDLEHLTSISVHSAQPAALPPLQLRRPVDLGDGLFVCGDHRDTPSIQGAMASGARASRAVLRALRHAADQGGPASARQPDRGLGCARGSPLAGAGLRLAARSGVRPRVRARRNTRPPPAVPSGHGPGDAPARARGVDAAFAGGPARSAT